MKPKKELLFGPDIELANRIREINSPLRKKSTDEKFYVSERKKNRGNSPSKTANCSRTIQGQTNNTGRS